MYYEGERIRLRPPERAEVPLYQHWLMNPEQRFYITQRYMSLAIEEKWFERMLEASMRQPPSDLYFVIELRETKDKPNLPIGMTGLHGIHWLNRSAEFGIVIGEPDFWGQGYGRDATRTILEVGFLWYGLHRIHLTVLEDNLRAIRAYESVGFKHEGVSREATLVNGVYKNTLRMSILEHEFKAGLQK